MADETGPPRSKYPPPKPPAPAPNPPQAQQTPPAGYPQQAQPGYPQQQGYPQQPGYGPQQPGYGPAGVRAPAQPSAHWPVSVISFLCFFLIGVIAIYFSAQVGSRWRAGNLQGAEKASRMALTWGIVGIVLGGLILFLAALGSAGGGSY
jgi:Interferon-induced transmembrane protein